MREPEEPLPPDLPDFTRWNLPRKMFSFTSCERATFTAPYPREQFVKMVENNADIIDGDLACIVGDQEWSSPHGVANAADDRFYARQEAVLAAREKAEQQQLDAETVAEFAREFQSDLAELQSVGFARQAVSAKTKQAILTKAVEHPEDAYLYLQQFLFRYFPDVLTSAGRQDLEEQAAKARAFEDAEKIQWKKKQRMGEFAPRLTLSGFSMPARTPTELDATPKQVVYLIDLGVAQSDLPADLGKWQASALIDFCKKQRGDD